MPQTYRPFQAAFWMLGSILSFSSMAVAGRFRVSNHSTFEIMAIRSLIGFVVVVVIIGLGVWAAPRNERKPHQGSFFQQLFPFCRTKPVVFRACNRPIGTSVRARIHLTNMGDTAQPGLSRRATDPTADSCRRFRLHRHSGGRQTGGKHNRFRGDRSGYVSDFFAATIIMTKALTRRESIVSILFWLTGIQLCFGFVALALATLDRLAHRRHFALAHGNRAGRPGCAFLPDESIVPGAGKFCDADRFHAPAAYRRCWHGVVLGETGRDGADRRRDHSARQLDQHPR
jgi:hypothetical protein